MKTIALTSACYGKDQPDNTYSVNVRVLTTPADVDEVNVYVDANLKFQYFPEEDITPKPCLIMKAYPSTSIWENHSAHVEKMHFGPHFSVAFCSYLYKLNSEIINEIC